MVKAKAKKVIRLVHFLLDETGSMQSKAEEAVNGYNKFLDDFKPKRGVEVRFSLTKFNSTHQALVHDAVLMKDAPRMTLDDFRPGSMTNLLDATANVIRGTQKKVEELKAESAMVISLTDGMENASREMTKENLNALIKEREADGWEFMYLGVAQEAFANADIYKGTRAAHEGRVVLDSAPGSTDRGMLAASSARTSYTDK